MLSSSARRQASWASDADSVSSRRISAASLSSGCAAATDRREPEVRCDDVADRVAETHVPQRCLVDDCTVDIRWEPDRELVPGSLPWLRCQRAACHMAACRVATSLATCSTNRVYR